MPSSPLGFHADQRSLKQRGERTSSIQRTQSPRLRQRALSGRIARRGSGTSFSLSARNQQILWDTATSRAWDAELAEPPLQKIQPLQYITPQSLTTSPAQSTAPSSPAISLEAIPAVLTTPVASAVEPVDEQALLSSMDFLVPSNYNHFGSYSTNYTSNYMDPYSRSGQGDGKPRPSPPHTFSSHYPGARHHRPEQEDASQQEDSPSPKVETGEHHGAAVYQHPDTARYAYAATTTASSAYSYAPTHHPGSAGYQYQNTYQAANEQYAHQHYNAHYAPQPNAYVAYPNHTYPSGGYTSPGMAYPVPAGKQHSASVSESSRGRGKPICWDHGCNGREFSTFSNYLRHKREKEGQSKKYHCHKCTATFTRTTARNGHVNNDKCKSNKDYDDQD